MNILNIKLASIEQTDLGFEHWIDVTYQVPILKNKYTVKLLLLMECKIEEQEVIEYLVSTWKYRDLVMHSLQMHEMEKMLLTLTYFNRTLDVYTRIAQNQQ